MRTLSARYNGAYQVEKATTIMSMNQFITLNRQCIQLYRFEPRFNTPKCLVSCVIIKLCAFQARRSASEWRNMKFSDFELTTYDNVEAVKCNLGYGIKNKKNSKLAKVL